MLNIGIQLNSLAFIVSTFLEVQEIRVHTPFLSVTNQSYVRQGVVEKFRMSLSDVERDVFDDFSFLLAQRDIIQVDLGVRSYEEVELVAEHERKAQDLLRFRESELHFLGLLLF